MNASVRESDHGPSKDEPLRYAPKKARQAEPDAAPAETLPNSDSAAPERPSAVASEPPWRRSQNRSGGGAAAFAGDVAIAELRTKLALAPDRLPEPPPPSTGGSKLVWASRITGVAVVVAVGFLGYRWGSTTRFTLPQPTSHNPVRPVERGLPPPDIGGLPVTPAVFPPPGRTNTASPGLTRQVTVGIVPPQQADEMARLNISAPDAGNAGILIVGLASGASLSAGREVAPGTWRLSVDELAGVAVIPPRGFSGTMDLAVELRFPDGSVADRKPMPVEWLSRVVVAAKPVPRQHDAAEIAQMLKRASDLMVNGDVSSARLMYQRAAEAGEALAAFALAETYDPLVQAKGGIPSDIALAQSWYAKARDMGVSQAAERLDRLAKSPEQQ
jgi:hypothetical protein